MAIGTFSRALLCSSALLAITIPAQAEEATQLDLITVTVNKIKQVLSQVAGGVSVETKKDKDLYGQHTVQKIVSGMPGVSASQTASDPATAINIRGLQDFGRVAVTIDGARQNFQRSGHNANGMFYFEPEQMQQVTVTRGPIANIYGSGAIGGVASFDTLDALTFLRGNEQIAGSQKLSYDSNGGNLLSSTTGGMRLGTYGAVLGNIVFRNNGNYVDGNGNTVNSSSRNIAAGLGKVTFTPSDEVRVDLGYVINNDNFHTPGTTQYDNAESTQTLSGKLSYKPKDNDLIDFTGSAYWTGTNQNQMVTAASNAALIGKHRDFNISTTGTDLYNTSRFATGGMKHAVTIGGDVFSDTVNTQDQTGSSAGAFTPSGHRSVGGGFVQDKVDVNTWIEVLVAGRYDTYELDSASSSSSGSHFSPKGTVILKPFENTALHGLNFYGTYAEGYRAPAITETLINGFHPGGFSFAFFPNPNLRPEVGHTVEAGITGKWDHVFKGDDTVSLRADIFQNTVDDFIDGVYNPTYDPVNYPFGVYQYQNVANARLQGLEAEVNYDSSLLFGGVAGSMIRGDNLNSGSPLTMVPADKVVTTVGFHFDDQKGSLGARWSAVAAQDRLPAGSPASKAYNLVDVFATYNVNDNLSVGLNLNNLFNEYYEPYLDGSYAPGRSAMLTVTTRLGK